MHLLIIYIISHMTDRNKDMLITYSWKKNRKFLIKGAIVHSINTQLFRINIHDLINIILDNSHNANDWLRTVSWKKLSSNNSPNLHRPISNYQYSKQSISHSSHTNSYENAITRPNTTPHQKHYERFYTEKKEA